MVDPWKQRYQDLQLKSMEILSRKKNKTKQKTKKR